MVKIFNSWQYSVTRKGCLFVIHTNMLQELAAHLRAQNMEINDPILSEEVVKWKFQTPNVGEVT